MKSLSFSDIDTLFIASDCLSLKSNFKVKVLSPLLTCFSRSTSISLPNLSSDTGVRLFFFSKSNRHLLSSFTASCLCLASSAVFAIFCENLFKISFDWSIKSSTAFGP